MFLSLRLRLERRGRPYLSRADSCLTGRVSYLSGWSEHEIFRAARDAHKAADLLLQLELHQSLDKALAEVNKPSTAKDLPPEPELKNAATFALNVRSAVQVEL